MQRHPRYTRDRIAQVGERIRARIWADVRDPDVLRVAGPVDRIPPDEAERLDYRDASLGDTFGPLWATYWFQVGATVPEEWAGERVDLLWISHSEATLWIGGRSVQGLNTSPMGARIDAQVLGSAGGGERLDLRVELACNGKFGKLDRPFASREPVVLDRCQIARFDREAWELHHDFDVLRRLEADAANGLDESWAGRLLAGLNEVCNVWSEDDRGQLGRARGRSSASCWPTATARTCTGCRRSATGTWTRPGCGRWPRPTARPSARSARRPRTWSATRSSGSPARRPSSTTGSARATPTCTRGSAGRSRPGAGCRCGGTWIEPDCNLPSGESLVRQFLYGQRFFEREFGRRCNEFWNPDVFGYNGQLPQIMRGSGIGRFLTQKLSWNRFNPPPYHTFTWQGIDGSRGARALPTGRHLQRHRRGGRAAPHRARLQGSRPLRPQPAGVRLGRRWRRPDAGDAGDAAPGRRPAGRAAHLDDDQRRVLRCAGGGCRGAGDGGRRAVLRVSPRHLHDPGGRQERQPGRGAGAARRRVPLGGGRRRAAARAAGRARGSCCC